MELDFLTQPGVPPSAPLWKLTEESEEAAYFLIVAFHQFHATRWVSPRAKACKSSTLLQYDRDKIALLDV